MEAESLDASCSCSAEVDNPVLDSDLYDADIYEVPDPGFLSEKNESCPPEQEVLRLFSRTPRWQALPLRSRARRLWLILRAYLHEVVEKEKREELRVARLAHGLEPLRHLEVTAGLCSVAQDAVGGRFVVLDGEGRLHLHTKDGWVQGKRQAPAPLTGLVAVPAPLGAVGRFLGWGPAGLALLRPDLSLLWLGHPPAGGAPGGEPTCCLPVPSLGLLLVVEAGGSLTLWKFRSGGRRLVPHRLPLQLPRSLSGSFKRLALGPAPARHGQHCFAAYGPAVLTFDLEAWTLVDVRQNLHKTTILDLVYCKEIEAMVTASRDSTVKVWAADWQIRMVFVGHTGPVTAMALLPNTSLLLSASQDGTLRTWDLRAAEQVGEVALDYWGRDARSGPVGRLLAPAGPGWPVLCLCPRSVDLWNIRDLYSPLAQLPAQVLHLQVAPALPAPSEPPLPVRLVCACADGSVSLVSAATGRTVSALLLGPEDRAAAVAYCLPREALWLLTRAGHLVRANAARCPMAVLHRHRPPPPPAPQPGCLHLYSHLIDGESAAACWEAVRLHQGDPSSEAVAWAWRNKNRYLPMLGHTDGTLSVLDLRTSKTVFRTEAHRPGPVTAIASTWNSVVTSGGDLTVKMWRVFPYAEESLSLLRTFSCCHPARALCALGRRITVGFEDPESATYGLVQFGLGSSPRCDHRPQDDPKDHITGLCCCPTLKLYACSSLDCTVRIWTLENRLLRLLQLDSAPQALAFCGNSGDLVLALGSRLCLVSHSLYLPTSYLVKKLCQASSVEVEDPPLPVTSWESLTAAQLQKLADLQGKASLSAALSFTHRQTPTLQQPVLKEDLEALLARDQDLQQLKKGLLAPAAQPPLSWRQQQEAFHNYLRVIYGPGLAGIHSRVDGQQKDTSGMPPTAPLPLDQHSAHPPPVSLPIPPIQRKVHSQASQLLASSSLSCCLGLSLDLQLKSDKLQGKTAAGMGALPFPKEKAPVLLRKKPKELLSKLKGFFPATTVPHESHPRPINFPGYVPNSVVLQKMWLFEEVTSLGTMANLVSSRFKSSLYSQWLRRHRHSADRWRRRLAQWLHSIHGGYEEEEEEEEHKEWEEEEEKLEFDWSTSVRLEQKHHSWQPKAPVRPKAPTSVDLSPRPPSFQQETQTSTSQGSQYEHKRSRWAERYGHLPKFLQFFVVQNWFKKLFPIFTLEAYPEMGTVDGLASMLVSLLGEASWADCVSILHALMRLLPDMSGDLHDKLQKTLLHLLNLDPPPSFEDETQKQFVILALQLLMACTLECREVVLELMSYFLYSPTHCRPEVKELMDRLGLQDPHDFLCKEMLTWVQGQNLHSKAVLRSLCCQKLDDIIQQLERETLSEPSLSLVMSSVSRTSTSLLPEEAPPPLRPGTREASGVLWMAPQASQQISQFLELPFPVAPPAEQEVPDPEEEFQHRLWQFRFSPTKRVLSEALKTFGVLPMPEVSIPRELPSVPLPLEQAEWALTRVLDLSHVDVLSLFCELQQLRRQRSSSQQEETLFPASSSSDQLVVPNSVERPPREPWLHPILRLQESRAQSLGMRLPGHRLRRPRQLDGSIEVLKLPLPRVDLQPFPPGWPKPARALPPLLLQPTLQRYFLPGDADPDSYQ
ncbi:WD repeat-containing protein 97 [Perognathus longimembris pacificus]|uniref:WD repeat-containing protein 97 n=1 Tax=Perognathus longimembris pacificus TaxID=214514 RepID=UPI002018BE02|nr:WD repeat-containing protein 97 [Perognathus longimembris pacificus]